MSAKTDSPHHQGIVRFAGVLCLIVAGVLIRDAYLLQYRSALPFYYVHALDAEYYDQWARNVAMGRGYGPMPFYMAPLYPYFLALVYKIAGYSYPIAYAVQEGLGLLNLVLTYLLGRRLFGHLVGMIAIGLLILYGPVVYLESKLLSETMGITLGLASILLMIRALDRPTLPRCLIAGLVLGLSALCRPVVLLFIALVLVWIILRRQALKSKGFTPVHALMLAIGIGLAILPVTVRNYAVGKGFALICTNSGIVFAQGNNPYAIGIEMPMPGFTTAIVSQQQEEMRIASKALGHRVNAFESSAYWFNTGLQFIRRNPGSFALLLAKKLVWSLHSREAGSSYNINFERRFVPTLRFLILPFAVLSGFGLYGFVRDGRREKRLEAELPAIQVGSIFLGLIVFSVSSRYRAPAVPVLAVMAGYGIQKVIEHLRNREFTRLALAAAWIAPMFLISLVPYPIPPVMASEPGNLGVAYMALGDMDNAIKYLGEAIEMSPDSSLAHLNMGVALTRLDRLEEANEYFRESLRIAPNDERLHFQLANNLMAMGRSEDAVLEYRKALETNPDNAEAHVNLGVAYYNLDMNADAAKELKAALSLRPDLADAHHNLAWVYYYQGNYANAWKEARLAERYSSRRDRKLIEALTKEMPDPGQ